MRAHVFILSMRLGSQIFTFRGIGNTSLWLQFWDQLMTTPSLIAFPGQVDAILESQPQKVTPPVVMSSQRFLFSTVRKAFWNLHAAD